MREKWAMPKTPELKRAIIRIYSSESSRPNTKEKKRKFRRMKHKDLSLSDGIDSAH